MHSLEKLRIQYPNVTIDVLREFYGRSAVKFMESNHLHNVRNGNSSVSVDYYYRTEPEPKLPTVLTSVHLFRHSIQSINGIIIKVKDKLAASNMGTFDFSKFNDIDIRTFYNDTSPDYIIVYCKIELYDCRFYWKKVFDTD